jgi:hypothetical protein
MTMLTGGIDLSVGTVATMSAFIVATQTPVHGPWVAMMIAGAVWETLAWRAIYPAALTCGQEAFRTATPFGGRSRDRVGDRRDYAATAITRTRVPSKSSPSRHMA